ncbi:hypothetical protein ABZ484_28745 [Streptomyces sp. NPDC006393]|uniref:hypothetical protein n=1 Tax=Streptomyces sp. NPDC006393 TaxID=3156763 RepID=UPI0033E3D670
MCVETMDVSWLTCAARLSVQDLTAGQGREELAVENTSPLPPNVPPRPSSAPTVHAAPGSTDSPNGWRDEYEYHPEYQRILARMEKLWWQRPITLWCGVVAVAAASFFLGGALLGSDGDATSSSTDPWVQGQVDDQSQNGQQQNNQPAGLSYQQKQQILNKFCNSSQMRGEPGDSSAFPTCMASYYVTDQGMVMQK